MRFFHAVLPNLSIALNLALVVVFFLDLFNPMMGFTHGWAYLVLFLSAVISSLAASVCLYADWRKRRHADVTSEEDD